MFPFHWRNNRQKGAKAGTVSAAAEKSQQETVRDIMKTTRISNNNNNTSTTTPDLVVAVAPKYSFKRTYKISEAFQRHGLELSNNNTNNNKSSNQTTNTKRQHQHQQQNESSINTSSGSSSGYLSALTTNGITTTTTRLQQNDTNNNNNHNKAAANLYVSSKRPKIEQLEQSLRVGASAAGHQQTPMMRGALSQQQRPLIRQLQQQQQQTRASRSASNSMRMPAMVPMMIDDDDGDQNNTEDEAANGVDDDDDEESAALERFHNVDHLIDDDNDGDGHHQRQLDYRSAQNGFDAADTNNNYTTKARAAFRVQQQQHPQTTYQARVLSANAQLEQHQQGAAKRFDLPIQHQHPHQYLHSTANNQINPARELEVVTFSPQQQQNHRHPQLQSQQQQHTHKQAPVIESHHYSRTLVPQQHTNTTSTYHQKYTLPPSTKQTTNNNNIESHHHLPPTHITSTYQNKRLAASTVAAAADYQQPNITQKITNNQLYQQLYQQQSQPNHLYHHQQPAPQVNGFTYLHNFNQFTHHHQQPLQIQPQPQHQIVAFNYHNQYQYANNQSHTRDQSLILSPASILGNIVSEQTTQSKSSPGTSDEDESLSEVVGKETNKKRTKKNTKQQKKSSSNNKKSLLNKKQSSKSKMTGSRQQLTAGGDSHLHHHQSQHQHQHSHHNPNSHSSSRRNVGAYSNSSSGRNTPSSSSHHKSQYNKTSREKPALNCCGKFAKLLLFITNISFWSAGIALGAWGILQLVDDHKYNVSQLLVFEPSSRMSLFQLLSWSFITLGCATILVGFCGCSAILKNNRWILGLYIFLILAIFALDLATGLLAIIFQEKLVANVRLRLGNKLRAEYGVQASFTAAIDYIQTKYQCCGLEGHFDYDQSLWRLQRLGGFEATVARTCCHLRNTLDDQAHINPRPVNESMCQSTDVRFHQSYRYRKGCLDDLERLIRQKIWFFTIGCGAVGAVILLSLLFATCFCRSISNGSSKGKNNDSFKDRNLDGYGHERNQPSNSLIEAHRSKNRLKGRPNEGEFN